MNEYITRCYWLLFDYVKSVLFPVPDIVRNYPGNELDYLGIGSVMPKTYDFTISFHTNPEEYIQGIMYEYGLMCEFLTRAEHLGAVLRENIVILFAEKKAYKQYAVFLHVLINMVKGGKIKKDYAVQILSESENHEALIEFLQALGDESPEENADRFRI